MEHCLHFTFSVQLTETITVMAPDEDAARAFLAQGFGKFAGPTRQRELEGDARMLKQSLEQHAVELLSVEDPMPALEAEERKRWGGRTATEYGKALEDRWQRLEPRLGVKKNQDVSPSPPPLAPKGSESTLSHQRHRFFEMSRWDPLWQPRSRAIEKLAARDVRQPWRVVASIARRCSSA